MKKKNKNNLSENLYNGFIPKSSNWKPTKIDADIDPQEFFEKYIKTRTPVLFKDTLKDEEWKVNKWNDLKYLDEKSSNCVIQLEKKENGQFGKGKFVI